MIYWDANATSRLRPQAREAVAELLAQNQHLNPSSIHQEGRKARALLRQARDRILNYLFRGGPFSKRARLVFVSGGTEGCNSLINGFLNGCEPKMINLVSSSIEHAAILEPLKSLASKGANLDLINPDKSGRINVDEFLKVITSKTTLASLMLANNETGCGQPVKEIVREVKKISPETVFISDISQAASKTFLNVGDLFDAGVDAVVLSAHKIGALAGIGAIIFNTQSICRMYEPLIRGGGQEDKLRGGTEFVLGAHVFGVVAELLNNDRAEIRNRLSLKQKLISDLKQIKGISVLETLEHEYDLVNTIYVRAANLRADDFVVALDLEKLICSTGSACSSGRQDVSHVPLAMGYEKAEAREFFRISLDWDATENEIEKGLNVIRSVATRFN